ncbi:MAG: hypothetical protein CMI01_06485 [Oceanospirillaceae bacterium]|nr:hypothetical protein [Oceanospirillaceae bacterium]
MQHRDSIYQLGLLLLIAVAGGFGAWQAYSVSSLLEQNRQDANLRKLAQVQAFRAQDLLGDAEQVLEAYTAFFQASKHVTDLEYRQFSSTLLPQRIDVYAVHWAPKVGAAQRPAHETELQARGLAAGGIFELDNASLSSQPAQARPTYFPITYSEPLNLNRRAIGLDVTWRFIGESGPIQRALAGQRYTTPPFPIVQDGDGPWAVAIFQPVFEAGSEPFTLERLRGFLVLLLRPEILLTERLNPILEQPYQMRLLDISEPRAIQIYPRQATNWPTGQEYRFDLELGGRNWEFEIAFEEQPHLGVMPALLAGLVVALTLVIVLAVGRSFRQSTALRLANTELSRLAHIDPLTGLANRRRIEELAEQIFALEVRQNSFSAVCVVDLDNFKQVNDRFGHQRGDNLLIELAEVLRCGLRSADVAARIGGDEFVLLMPQLHSVDDVTGVLVRLLEAISDATWGQDQVDQVSASIGVALSGPECRDFSVLQQRADRAMYAAKRAGKNRYMIWSKTL